MALSSGQLCGMSTYKPLPMVMPMPISMQIQMPMAMPITVGANQFPPSVRYSNEALYSGELEEGEKSRPTIAIAIASRRQVKVNASHVDDADDDAEANGPMRRAATEPDGDTDNDNDNDDDDDNDDEEDDDAEDEEADSLASLETLSDNVSIWVNGEKHWVSGVDATTTCADLICALLLYQDGQQQLLDTANRSADDNNAINQSTAEPAERLPADVAAARMRNAAAAAAAAAAIDTYVIVKQIGGINCKEQEELELDGAARIFDVLPPTRKDCELFLRRLGQPQAEAQQQNQNQNQKQRQKQRQNQQKQQITSLLSTDKDSGMGSPVGSSRSARLRRRKHNKSGKSLSSSWLAQANTPHPKLVHRVTAAEVSPNDEGVEKERLVKIIMAQDETIHRQLTLLREKEHQISRIEEEQHRMRERELGKNYLLETYLKGLDAPQNVELNADADEEGAVAAVAAEDAVEIFIDEPYQRPQQPKSKARPADDGPKRAKRHPRRSRHERHDEQGPQAAQEPPERDTEAAMAERMELQQQIAGLEKVYAINRQLQREEELLLKLHAKIRKQHVKRAYQTKREVLDRIEQLDATLAMQCADIRQVEGHLVHSNQQLKQKLYVLEQLSHEFIVASKSTTNSTTTEAYSVDELLRLQATIAKPNQIHAHPAYVRNLPASHMLEQRTTDRIGAPVETEVAAVDTDKNTLPPHSCTPKTVQKQMFGQPPQAANDIRHLGTLV